MKLLREYNSTVLLHRAREAVSAALREYRQQGKEVLMLCAGGSAFQLLGEIDPAGFGRYLTITVLDERASNDPNINNFAQLVTTTFHHEAAAAGARFIDTRMREGETRDLLASRFEYALRNWKELHSDGTIFALMGVGVDGHVAGIMRYPDDSAKFAALFEDADSQHQKSQKSHWVVAYEAPPGRNDFPERVTVTLPFLRTMVDRAIVFMSGPEKKKDAFIRLNASRGSIADTPARILYEMKDVVLYTDVI